MQRLFFFIVFFSSQLLNAQDVNVPVEEKGFLGLDEFQVMNLIYLVSVLVVILFMRRMRNRNYKE
ncbi:MAG TPA: hypothetical protein DEP18_00615 [Flavobacteriales bacterium]|nr:hypothetical protein [Flavobacteriales bacterium]HRE75651.1 hypothetical protein [Flavobacteriales bacterium]HRE96661.1 hypothetical protein [Flavobacteriales bacterium]HRJ36099.1 hypothetical protein [Flavobacteriales bacterium]HRJ39971.1 hypothetical protein [Flavobacteriales bacterium]